MVGEATAEMEAQAVAAQEDPDVMLLSLNGDDRSSLDLIPALLHAAEGARVLILTEVRDPEVHQQAVRLGARGVVRKEHPPEVLIKAIETVYAGEMWLARTMMARVLSDLSQGWVAQAVAPAAAEIALLTAREREVIRLIGEGFKNKQIRDRLSISEETVRHHLTSIFGKLGVADRLALVIYAHRYGLATPPAAWPS